MRRNMLPLVARNRRRSKAMTFSCWIMPATKPSRTALGSSAGSDSRGASMASPVHSW